MTGSEARNTVFAGDRQVRSYLPNVEQLSQLFPDNWDNCTTLGIFQSADCFT